MTLCTYQIGVPTWIKREAGLHDFIAKPETGRSCSKVTDDIGRKGQTTSLKPLNRRDQLPVNRPALCVVQF